jgi:hypothetical protein
MKAKSAKRKGTNLERWVCDELRKIGLDARKQPGSGIYQDFPHDVSVKLGEHERLIIECKSWKDGWRTGDKAMGKADLLVIKRNYGEPRVYMSWETLEYLLKRGEG